MKKNINLLTIICFIIMLIGITGCNPVNVGNVKETGLTPKIAMANAKGGLQVSLNFIKKSMSTKASDISDVIDSVTFHITGTNLPAPINQIVQRADFKGQGWAVIQINDLLPGTINVTVEAKDASGNVIATGHQDNITVIPGDTIRIRIDCVINVGSVIIDFVCINCLPTPTVTIPASIEPPSPMPTACCVTPTPTITDTPTPDPTPSAKWTIMVYMAADNSLYDDSAKDLTEMQAGINTQNVNDINVIVLFDGLPNGDSAIYKIKPGGKDLIDDNASIIPVDTHEVNMGNPITAQHFVQWTIQHYPAQNYMIDTWDHGSGIFSYAGRSLAPQTKGFAEDAGSGSVLQAKDLTGILSTAMQTSGKKIEILGFDACLMEQLEIAYQVKDYCKILVGSEAPEPGLGWDYQSWFAGINTNMSPSAVASLLVDTYANYYSPYPTAQVTLSAIDLNAMTTTFIPALNNLADTLKNSVLTYKSEISNARNTTQLLDADKFRYYVDIGEFIKNIKNPAISAEITTAATNAENAYGNIVIREAHNPYYPNVTGLAIYFPVQLYNTAYDNPAEILFAEQPAWGNFIKELYFK